MKTKTKLIALIVASCALLSGAFAGGWSHGQYSPGSFSDTPYVPSAATVQQTLQAFGTGTAVNSGPLGYYSTNAGPQLYYSGSIGGGTNVYVYQVVVSSGYSVTAISW